MSGWELFQIWLMAFVTLALFSFMYKDNPVYRIAEHIFAGLTAGYQVGLIWDTVIQQQLWDPMLSGKWWLLVPGILGCLMFTRFSQRYSWVSRISLAFVMGVTAGIFIISQLHGLVLPQMQDTMIARTQADKVDKIPVTVNNTPFVLVDSTSDMATIDSLYPNLQVIDKNAPKDMRIEATFKGEPDLGTLEYYAPVCSLISLDDPKAKYELAKVQVYNDNDIVTELTQDSIYNVSYNLSSYDSYEPGRYKISVGVQKTTILLILTIIIVIGVVSTLIYFYFSHEHKGALGVTAKVGIWFIMISFGAHFGYTVMARVSLLIGRVQFLVEDWVGSFHQLF